MKIIKLIPIAIGTAMLIITAFAACKKDRGDSFDPQQYYIVTTAVKGKPVPVLTGIIVFSAASKCLVFNNEDLQPDVLDYQYQNGHITITDASMGKPEVLADITIANGQIQNITSESDEFLLYKSDLYRKLPDANSFKGKSFSGTYYTEGDSRPAGAASFHFDDAKWVGNGFNGLYDLHNNAFASSPSEENGKDILHFVIVGNKLLFYSIKYNAYGQLNENTDK